MLRSKMDAVLIEYTTPDGLSLDGQLFISKKGNKKVVIHEHGMHSNFFNGSMIKEMAQRLKGSDYDFFSTNNRGFGISSRFFFKEKKKSIGTAFEIFEECIHDIEGAIETMKKLGYTDVVLSGQSTGCQKVTYYQGEKKNPIVKGVILLSPTDDYNFRKTSLGKKFFFAYTGAKIMVATGMGNNILPHWASKHSAMRFLSYTDPKNVEAQLFNYSGEMKHLREIKCPILALFGTEENHLGDKSTKEMLQILREKSNSRLLVTKEIEGDNHEFEVHPHKASKIILDFLKKINK
jgi:alpha-beta hydrolase superfamily lysophospholipase